MLTSFSPIMRRDLVKSKHPVSFSGKKVLGLSRLVALDFFLSKAHCLAIFSKFVEFDLWCYPFNSCYSFASIFLPNIVMFNGNLQLEDRVMQFPVAPVLASIIMKFQDQTRYRHSPSIPSGCFDCSVILYFCF